MKTILRLTITLGFVLMIGTAGGADNANISFFTAFLLELCGVLVILFGYSALCNYKRYLRRRVRTHKEKVRLKTRQKEFSLT